MQISKIHFIPMSNLREISDHGSDDDHLINDFENRFFKEPDEEYSQDHFLMSNPCDEDDSLVDEFIELDRLRREVEELSEALKLQKTFAMNRVSIGPVIDVDEEKRERLERVSERLRASLVMGRDKVQ
jgi:hypothetical protein